MTGPKFNPFKPGNIVHPGMFVGRLDELKVIERCLFQTKHGNPQHFLVQGERGIGKSSLLFYVEVLSRSQTAGDAPFNFLTISVDIGRCQSQIEIVRKLGRGMRTAIGDKQAIKDKAKGIWDWLTNWEVLGVRYHKPEDEIDSEEVLEQFVSKLTQFCAETEGAVDGILFLIDEADRPSSDAGLGEMLKLVSERLTKHGCNRVCFGLAGLPSVMTRLRESHDSSPRLFHTMLLEPLEVEERKQVVRLGINEANQKNTVRTLIEPDALIFLAELSEGYPNFVQQFSYCAFETDIDDVIDEEDVAQGAFGEGGAISQLGDKYFNEMYHARIASEDYRRVLDAMADYGDGWVSRQQIIKESGVSESIVTNALQTLKARGIIIPDDKRRGFYKLPTNSFAAWINAIRSARAKADATIDAIF